MESANLTPSVEYPSEIRGSLRLTLHIKDQFIVAFNLIEDYRSALLLCQRGFSRDLAVYNLDVGLKGINQLRSEIEEVEHRVKAKVNRNRALRHYLKVECGSAEEKSRHANRALGVVSTLHIPTNKAGRKSGRITECDGELNLTAPLGVEAALHGGFETKICDVNIDQMHVPPEVDLSSCMTKSAKQLLPVVDFYRGFYFLQMHFQIAMCLTANYAMPLITGNMSVGQRVKGWPSNLGKPAKRGKPATVGNRLRDIQIEVANLTTRLRECMLLVEQKLTQDRIIESYYRQYTISQERIKRGLLRCIQTQRKYCETLDCQNDRLAGLASKVDKAFPRISKFHDFTSAEGIYELLDESVTDDSKVAKDNSSMNTQKSEPLYTHGNSEHSSNNSTKSSLRRSNSGEVKFSEPITGESRLESTRAQGSDSVNQLLLGADPIAPGSNPMRDPVSSAPRSMELTEIVPKMAEEKNDASQTKLESKEEKVVVLTPTPPPEPETEKNTTQTSLSDNNTAAINAPPVELETVAAPESIEAIPTESSAQAIVSTLNEDNVDEESSEQEDVAPIPSVDESNSNIRQNKRSMLKKSETDGQGSLKLPDINDNHSTTANVNNHNRRQPIVLRTGKISNLKRAQLRNQFIKETMADSFSSDSLSEDSWMAEDVFLKVPQVSEAKCIPRWLKRASPELQTEEELCSDATAANRRVSNSDLEKRQELVDTILQADGQRLEDILTTLLQHH